MLNRLVEFARRIQNLPPPMYAALPFRWQIELDNDGNYRGLTPLSDGQNPNRGLPIHSPNIKRTSAINPLLLADNAKYVLGRGADSPSESPHFRAFLALARECAETTHEPSVEAVVRFLESHQAMPQSFPEEMNDGDNICFRVETIRPTDLESVRGFWVTRNLPRGNQDMQCIVCGEIGPVDRVSPVAIKGLGRIGGQSSGMALVSANKEAFLSYGAEQALIAPTCRTCGEAYGNALNHLIAKEGQHSIFIGPTCFVFWTREDSEFNPATLISQPTEEDVQNLIESYRSGREFHAMDANAFYSLSISASASRVVIRDWLETTVPAVQTSLARWFALQRIADTNGSDGRPFGVYALAASLYRNPNDEMVANVPRVLVHCALQGGPLPDWLLAQAIGRNRAEQSITRNRAALIKAILLSQQETEEGYMERLDTTCNSPGYLCGRLLAELENAQREAISPKATLVDRFYGAASASPAIVFGNLLRNAQAHMAKLRKDNPAAYRAIDDRIQEIASRIREFPKTLNLKEQALFALGYYHQKAANRADAIRHAANNSNENESEEEE